MAFKFRRLTGFERPEICPVDRFQRERAGKPPEVRACAEIIHTLCLPQFAIAALSSVNVPRHASLLRLALTNSFGAFCTNNLFTVPYWRQVKEFAGCGWLKVIRQAAAHIVRYFLKAACDEEGGSQVP